MKPTYCIEHRTDPIGIEDIPPTPINSVQISQIKSVLSELNLHEGEISSNEDWDEVIYMPGMDLTSPLVGREERRQIYWECTKDPDDTLDGTISYFTFFMDITRQRMEICIYTYQDMDTTMAQIRAEGIDENKIVTIANALKEKLSMIKESFILPEWEQEIKGNKVFSVTFELKSFYENQTFNLTDSVIQDVEARDIDELLTLLEEGNLIQLVDDSSVINADTEISPIEVNIEYVLIKDSNGEVVYQM